MRRLLAAAALAGVLAGCGRDDTSITNGGRIPGQTLTVYSLLPRSGPDAAAARDAVLGEKLALQQARGMVGPLTVNYVALDLPGQGRKRIANTVRDAVHDPSIAAVIGDLSDATAQVSVPLLNAAGILHVSPGVTSPVFRSDERYQPSGRRTFAPLLASDEAQAAALAGAAGDDSVAVEATAGAPEQRLAGEVRRAVGKTVDTARADTVVVVASDPEDAFGTVEGVLAENPRARVLLPQGLWATDLPQRFKGRPRVQFLTTAGPPSRALATSFEQAFGTAPGPYAQVGYDAMRSVLAAVRRAGDRANSRQRIIDAYFAGGASRRPWLLARRTDSGTLYAPVVRR
jgi:ABC-type branched-subunit amino acid transport system substrate-binding protein